MTGLDPSTQIFLLRVAFVGLLYVFLAAVLYVIWRDLRAPRATASSAGRIRGRLVVLEGGTTNLAPGDSFPLKPVTSLGRDVSNTVILREASASAEHALLTRRDGAWWVEDLGSTNGTFLNGARLEGPAVVRDEDVIGIGRVRLKLDLAQ